VTTEERKDYTMQLTDQELFAICGGRRANKIARLQAPSDDSDVEVVSSQRPQIATERIKTKRSRSERDASKKHKSDKKQRKVIDGDKDAKRAAKKRKRDAELAADANAAVDDSAVKQTELERKRDKKRRKNDSEKSIHSSDGDKDAAVKKSKKRRDKIDASGSPSSLTPSTRVEITISSASSSSQPTTDAPLKKKRSKRRDQ
jgi:hypothetical protein